MCLQTIGRRSSQGNGRHMCRTPVTTLTTCWLYSVMLISYDTSWERLEYRHEHGNVKMYMYNQ